MKIYRIIDANLNRASEGLRVIEEISRFIYQDALTVEKIKVLRHKVRETSKELTNLFLSERNSLNDCGFDISQKEISSSETDLKEIALRNFKRVQEAFRVIEENFRTKNYHDLAKKYEKYRFLSYQLEKSFFISDSKKSNPLPSDIYCITGEAFSLGRSNINVVKEMIKAGTKIIQYREKKKDMLAKYNECIIIRELTAKAGVLFIVNDDIDLAIITGADGVHIGQEDIPLKEVRRLVGNNTIIGISTHSVKQAQKAVLDGADYIGVGPIFKTYTKKDVVEPVGYEYLDYIIKNIKLPFVAIGGIKEHNIRELAKRGAKCFAMITEIVEAENICKKIESIRTAIK